jgi:hypothetical protein
MASGAATDAPPSETSDLPIVEPLAGPPEVEPVAGERIDVAPSPDLASGAPSEPEPMTLPATPAAPAPTAVRSWQPARQGSRDRAPVRETAAVDPGAEPVAPSIERVATAPQLRRFIKSRAYVPMHELRRRFAINGGDDDVTPVDLERSRVYVGLPEREGRLLGELLRGGDIGYELSLDPISPIVVGVYPMRPVTRG